MPRLGVPLGLTLTRRRRWLWLHGWRRWRRRHERRRRLGQRQRRPGRACFERQSARLGYGAGAGAGGTGTGGAGAGAGGAGAGAGGAGAGGVVVSPWRHTSTSSRPDIRSPHEQAYSSSISRQLLSWLLPPAQNVQHVAGPATPISRHSPTCPPFGTAPAWWQTAVTSPPRSRHPQTFPLSKPSHSLLPAAVRAGSLGVLDAERPAVVLPCSERGEPRRVGGDGDGGLLESVRARLPRRRHHHQEHDRARRSPHHDHVVASG